MRATAGMNHSKRDLRCVVLSASTALLSDVQLLSYRTYDDAQEHVAVAGAPELLLSTCRPMLQARYVVRSLLHARQSIASNSYDKEGVSHF